MLVSQLVQDLPVSGAIIDRVFVAIHCHEIQSTQHVIQGTLMQAISLRLPDPLFFDLMSHVKATAQTQTELIREAISDYLKRKAPVRKRSAADLAAKFAGTHDGPSDLSTNPKYLEGLGR